MFGFNKEGTQLSIFSNEVEKTVVPVIKKYSFNRVVGRLYFRDKSILQICIRR